MVHKNGVVKPDETAGNNEAFMQNESYFTMKQQAQQNAKAYKGLFAMKQAISLNQLKHGLARAIRKIKHLAQCLEANIEWGKEASCYTSISVHTLYFILHVALAAML